MNIGTAGLLATAVALSMPSVAYCAQQNFLTGVDQASIRKNLASGDLLAIQQTVDLACGGYMRGAENLSRRYEERERDADMALECVEGMRSLVVASATTLEERGKANEVMMPALSAAQRNQRIAEATTQFMDMSWGVGFGYSFGNDDAIDGAEIVDGVVRVSSERKDLPRAVFEFHRYFWCNKNRTGPGLAGCGPFVAVSATEDKLLSGVGVGFMYGRRAKVDDTEGFSVGVGVILDGKVKDLADGYSANQPAPDGATTVRFEEKSRWSTLIFVTRTF